MFALEDEEGDGNILGRKIKIEEKNWDNKTKMKKKKRIVQ